MFGPGSLALAPDTVEGRFLGGAKMGFLMSNLNHHLTIAIAKNCKNIPHKITLSPLNPFMKPTGLNSFLNIPHVFWSKKASLKASGGTKSFTTRWAGKTVGGGGGGGKVPKSQANDGYISRWWQLKYFFNFHPYLGKIPILTNIFQMGWNHQLDILSGWFYNGNPAFVEFLNA